MSIGKGIAIGFVAGVVAASGAVFLLRDDTSRAQEAARLAQLDAQIQQLDQSVSKLSALVASNQSRAAESIPKQLENSPAAQSREEHKHDADQMQEIAAADAMVDRGIASGHWSRAEATELSLAISDLDVKEQGRIQARIAAAINDGRVQLERR